MVFDRSWQQRVEKEFRSQMRSKGKMPIPTTVAREHKLREQTSVGRVFPIEVDSPPAKGLAQHHEHKAIEEQLKERLRSLEEELHSQREERIVLEGKLSAAKDAAAETVDQ